MRIAVVGGVAAGTSAAAKARRVDSDAEIVLFDKGNDISYAGCGLPYYISGLIPEREQVVVNTADSFKEKYNVDVRLGHEVTEIDTMINMLHYKNVDTGEEGVIGYDKLIISTGASPVKPPISGIDLDNIFTLRTVDSADEIKKAVQKDQIKEVAIIGAGLIGLEMAESFSELGLKVKVIEMQPNVLPQFSGEMAEIVEEHLREKGVELILNDGVKEFLGGQKVEKVLTQSGREIRADMVLLSIGVKPEVTLAEKSGVELGKTGAIKVNNRMETNIKDIYAAGDCAESTDIVSGKPVWVPLGSTANKQGRVAGENAAGGNYEHKGIQKTGITKIFDLTAATTGLSEDEARESGFDPLTIKIKDSNHAGYYPGVSKLNIKGVFDKKSRRLIGAEIIGGEGSDKRIDVLSTAIYSELKAEDLFQIDLAYAPPYSSPKDSAAVLGMVAEKKL